MTPPECQHIMEMITALNERLDRVEARLLSLDECVAETMFGPDEPMKVAAVPAEQEPVHVVARPLITVDAFSWPPVERC